MNRKPRNVAEALAGIASRNELVSVDAPEFGDGVAFHFRTRLSVSDVLAFPNDFFSQPAMAQNALLFRLLVRERDGSDPKMDEAEYAGADALALSEVVMRGNLRERVFEQLTEEGAKGPKGK